MKLIDKLKMHLPKRKKWFYYKFRVSDSGRKLDTRQLSSSGMRLKSKTYKIKAVNLSEARYKVRIKLGPYTSFEVWEGETK